MKKYKHYIIYTITNCINRKIYIGKHKCDNLDDDYFGSGKILRMAINKYSIENFIFHLEIDLHSQEEMDLLEELVVNEQFLARDDVYNVSRGGKNPCMYGSKNPFFGKTHTEKFRQQMSSRFKGKHISEEHKKNIGIGLHKLYANNPELRFRFVQMRKNKKKCKNVATGKISFFFPDAIPKDYVPYSKRKRYVHVSPEQKLKNKQQQNIRKKNSHWYNNGKNEVFCKKENAPNGYVLGRLPTLNVGRKYSDETIQKMRRSHTGKPAANKNKVYITNGVVNRYMPASDKLPAGWKYGLTRHKNERSKQ